MERRERER